MITCSRRALPPCHWRGHFACGKERPQQPAAHATGRSSARTRRATRVSCAPCQAYNKKFGGAHVQQGFTGNRGGERGLQQVQGQRHGQYEGGLDEQAVLQHVATPAHAHAPPPFLMSRRELDHGIQLARRENVVSRDTGTSKESWREKRGAKKTRTRTCPSLHRFTPRKGQPSLNSPGAGSVTRLSRDGELHACGLTVKYEVRLRRDGEREAAVAMRCACSGVTALRQYSSIGNRPVDRFTEPLYAPRNLPMVSATGSCRLCGHDLSSERHLPMVYRAGSGS